MIVRLLVCLATSFFVFGCASKGFNRESLQSQIGVAKPVFDDKEIKEAYNKKPNLPKPYRLAVYFKPAKPMSSGIDWRWTEDDKAVFDDLANDLKARGSVSNVFPIISSLVTADDIHSLRLAAAKHGADALLVIGGATQTDRYLNAAGWTYILLLPTLFVKGSEVDTLFMTNATLWDVKNEYLYLTAEAEATSSNTYPALFGKRDIELVNDAKTKALQKLKDQLRASIQGQKL